MEDGLIGPCEMLWVAFVKRRQTLYSIRGGSSVKANTVIDVE